MGGCSEEVEEVEEVEERMFAVEAGVLYLLSYRLVTRLHVIWPLSPLLNDETSQKWRCKFYKKK